MVVADASVAAKWLLSDEEDTDRANRLLLNETSGTSVILAPLLFRSEVANLLLRRVRRSMLTRDEAVDLFRDFLELQIEIVSPRYLERDALLFAEEYGLPAVYDAHYVVLARMTGVDMWTADGRLVRALGERLPFVRSLSEYGD